MKSEYPPGYVLAIQVLDSIMFLIGLCLLATPIAAGFYPGAYDTMIHVTFGVFICVCSVFRILVAYDSAWLEVVLCVLGVLTFFLPSFMHTHWDPRYADPHMAAGIIVIVLSIVSGTLSFVRLNRIRLALRTP